MNVDVEPGHAALCNAVAAWAASAAEDDDCLDLLAGLSRVGVRDTNPPTPLGPAEWAIVAEGLALAGHDPGPAVDAAADAADADTGLVVAGSALVGAGLRCLRMAQDRAADRLVGGRRVLEMQGPAHRLAEASVRLVRARVLVRRVAAEIGRGHEPHRAPAVAANAAEAALACAAELVQTFGAAGTAERPVVKAFTATQTLVRRLGPLSALWYASADRWLVVAP